MLSTACLTVVKVRTLDRNEAVLKARLLSVTLSKLSKLNNLLAFDMLTHICLTILECVFAITIIYSHSLCLKLPICCCD